MTDETLAPIARILEALTAIADHLSNVHEVAPGVSVGTDVSTITAAIARARAALPPSRG